MEETIDRESPTPWFQEAMKHGVILGIIHIILFVLLYYLVPSKLTGFSYIAAIFIINFGYCIYQGIQYRSSIGGFMGYGEAFKYVMVILFVNGLLNTVFVFLFLFIEPAMPDVMAKSQLDTSVYWAAKFGAPEESLDQVREKFNPEDVTKRFTALGLLTGIGFSLIFYAIGASIMALFVRKIESLDA